MKRVDINYFRKSIIHSEKYLKLFPSFFMTEILTWGYAILNGREGIKYKCLALKDGLSAKVDKKKIEPQGIDKILGL